MRLEMGRRFVRYMFGCTVGLPVDPVLSIVLECGIL